jgi:hypothetical protein
VESWYDVLMFLAVWPLVGLLIAAFGWAEDIAARRRARLWPRTKTAPGAGPSARAAAPAAPAPTEPAAPLTGADRPR